jgi:Cu/Zn superoxide dismutase
MRIRRSSFMKVLITLLIFLTAVNQVNKRSQDPDQATLNTGDAGARAACGVISAVEYNL